MAYQIIQRHGENNIGIVVLYFGIMFEYQQGIFERSTPKMNK